MAKKTLSLGSKEIEVIENCNIFDMYKDLYLTKTSVKTCTARDTVENGLKSSSRC